MNVVTKRVIMNLPNDEHVVSLELFVSTSEWRMLERVGDDRVMLMLHLMALPLEERIAELKAACEEAVW